MITNMLRHPARELVLFGVSQDCDDVVVCSAESVVSRPFRKHPAQELMSSFRANLSTFRRSAI